MIIKVELLIEVDDKHMNYVYKGDQRNWPQIILDQLSNIEDAEFKVIMGEAYEGGKAHG